VYIGIDDDDDAMLAHDESWFEEQLGLPCTITTFPATKPVQSYRTIYNTLIRQAAQDGMDFFVLWGDDVRLQNPDPNWPMLVYDRFCDYELKTGLPFGFGCVALNDVSAPGFPTFPVVARAHVEIFDGFSPEGFVNQDADPWVFQVYRRFRTASIEHDIRLENQIGGTAASGPARYDRQHVQWKDDVLRESVLKCNEWLDDTKSSGATATASTGEAGTLITLDVITPTFRTNMPLLRSIVTLDVPDGVSVLFIIIVDDPDSERIPELRKLETEYVGRVRVRVNQVNIGAGMTRNRGLDESAADWVLFLDDDVDVSAAPDLLSHYGMCVYVVCVVCSVYS
jgi:hypothetical protein